MPETLARAKGSCMNLHLETQSVSTHFSTIPLVACLLRPRCMIKAIVLPRNFFFKKKKVGGGFDPAFSQ